MKAKKILCATDFSPGSRVALEYASVLAAGSGATLIITHVDDTTPGLVRGDVGYGYLPQVDEIAEQEYHQLQATVPTVEGVPYEHRFLRGDAAEEILQLAEQEQVDFLVIGTHGKTGLQRVLMGSVAESIIRHARCPVLSIRQPIQESSAGPEEKQIARQS